MKTLIGAVLVLATLGAAPPAPRPWLDASLAPPERARLLVAAMTLDEKLAMLTGDTVLDGNGTGVNPCVGHISGNKRLGMPALCMGDGPAGVGNGLTGVTQFPAPVVGASTWDIDLMREYGVALGTEHAAKGRNVVLAPTINILRTPKWGRAAETLGEDPWLSARLGSEVTSGIQSRNVLATPKHFVANNQEWLRLGDGPDYTAIDVEVSERALHEIYYPAFKAVIEDAQAGSIMCAYNRVNAAYACENPKTLGQLKTWGFDGFVVADWYFAHRSTVAAANSGLDISMPGGASPFGFDDFYGPPLKKALIAGTISAATLDAMVGRVVTPMFRLGLVDKPNAGNVTADARSPAHLDLARRIAEKGTVLLRNERGVLPFGPRVRSIAVIGDDAGPAVHTTERYGGFVANAEIKPSTPLDAIRARAGTAVAVTYAPGTLGIGALPAVPATALRIAAGVAGLRATYYSTPGFEGPPLAVRTEPNIDQAVATLPNLPKIWSARWEGTLVPPKTGLYRFSLTGGGEIGLTIDGRRVATMPKHSFRLVTHGTIELVAGRAVPVRLDYSNAATISPTELRLGWQVPDPSLIEQAVAAARKADVAVVFVADDVSEGADRTDLKLPGDQDALIAAVAAANPKTVVVLHTVGPVLMPWRDRVAGIFASWYPGEQAGTAIATLLFGDANPSGKLPMTFPADEIHGPADRPERYPGVGTTVRYDEGILVGYRWYDAKAVTPLYPFGFGLSYTRFGYSDLKVERSAKTGWHVSAIVANLGQRAGSDVVQLYVGLPSAAGEPPRQLKGFRKVSLRAGEKRRVDFEIADADLRFWDTAAAKFALAPGAYRFELGHSSRDLVLSRTVGL